MKIENLYSETIENVARVAATVTWEDCDRPRQEIYFETIPQFQPDLTCDPHGFLIACLLPAMRHGEKRVAIDAPICPELRNGLLTVMSLMCNWYGGERKLVKIEAKPGYRSPAPNKTARAGSFLSGGIDSLATLRANRLDFPLEHPLSIKDCLVVHGFDIGGYRGCLKREPLFAQVIASLSEIAEDAHIKLIPVYTNIRHLDQDGSFWMNEYFGAALASVAHMFSQSITDVFIAAGNDTRNLKPHGSHPLIDPNYSSADLQIRHDGWRLSRWEKTKLLADWEIARHNIRVCTENPPDKLNCGKCEKCLRTMTALLALDKLTNTSAFPIDNLTSEMFNRLIIGKNSFQEVFYHDLLDPLQKVHRPDIANAIERGLAKGRLLRTIKTFDQKFLGSNLINYYRKYLKH